MYYYDKKPARGAFFWILQRALAFGQMLVLPFRKKIMILN